MTDTPKPLTAVEIADWALFATSQEGSHMSGEFAARIKATIEQQREQIEKLRSALVIAHRVADDWVNDQLRGTSLLKSALSELRPCREALASTEPTR